MKDDKNSSAKAVRALSLMILLVIALCVIRDVSQGTDPNEGIKEEVIFEMKGDGHLDIGALPAPPIYLAPPETRESQEIHDSNDSTFVIQKMHELSGKP